MCVVMLVTNLDRAHNTPIPSKSTPAPAAVEESWD